MDGMNFSVEMETGTGKTYVYLRTIYEMNKKYGFKIKTPIGNYNPDWALIKRNEKTVYFIAETKSAGQELKVNKSFHLKLSCCRFKMQGTKTI